MNGPHYGPVCFASCSDPACHPWTSRHNYNASQTSALNHTIDLATMEPSTMKAAGSTKSKRGGVKPRKASKAVAKKAAGQRSPIERFPVNVVIAGRFYVETTVIYFVNQSDPESTTPSPCGKDQGFAQFQIAASGKVGRRGPSATELPAQHPFAVLVAQGLSHLL